MVSVRMTEVITTWFPPLFSDSPFVSECQLMGFRSLIEVGRSERIYFCLQTGEFDSSPFCRAFLPTPIVNELIWQQAGKICPIVAITNSSPPCFWMKHGFIATILKQKHNLCNKRREKSLDTRKRIKVGAIWRQCSLFSLIRKVLYIYTNMFHKVAQTRSIIWKSL